jgi:superfamily II DNA helicase RecQ
MHDVAEGLPPTATTHKRSLDVLQKARHTTPNHDATKWRKELTNTFVRGGFGQEPYSWQLAVSEAITLRLDCLCIAGTGARKTIPFMAPSYSSPSRMTLILSPLKILQEEQVCPLGCYCYS